MQNTRTWLASSDHAYFADDLRDLAPDVFKVKDENVLLLFGYDM